MSLILEALRKLDRDKEAPERGLVVTGATIWARPEERRAARLAWVLLAGVVVAAGVWLLRGRSAPTPAAPPAASTAPADRTPGTAAAADQPFAAPGALAPSAVVAASPSVAPRVSPPAATAHASPLTQPSLAPPASPPRVAEPAAVAEDAAGDTPAPPGDVVLQAISARDGQPIAIVNGRMVREGDAFDGIRILRIGAAEIEVEVKGERRTVGF